MRINGRDPRFPGFEAGNSALPMLVIKDLAVEMLDIIELHLAKFEIMLLFIELELFADQLHL